MGVVSGQTREGQKPNSREGLSQELKCSPCPFSWFYFILPYLCRLCTLFPGQKMGTTQLPSVVTPAICKD